MTEYSADKFMTFFYHRTEEHTHAFTNNKKWSSWPQIGSLGQQGGPNKLSWVSRAGKLGYVSRMGWVGKEG